MNPYHPVAPFFEALTRPFLKPFQRAIPPIGGVDITPVLVLIACQLVLMLPVTWLEGEAVRMIARFASSRPRSRSPPRECAIPHNPASTISSVTAAFLRRFPGGAVRSLGTNAKRDVAPPETGRVLPGGRSKEKENAMELIAAAVAVYAIFIPVFLALEVATPAPRPPPR